MNGDQPNLSNLQSSATWSSGRWYIPMCTSSCLLSTQAWELYMSDQTLDAPPLNYLFSRNGLFFLKSDFRFVILDPWSNYFTPFFITISRIFIFDLLHTTNALSWIILEAIQSSLKIIVCPSATTLWASGTGSIRKLTELRKEEPPSDQFWKPCTLLSLKFTPFPSNICPRNSTDRMLKKDLLGLRRTFSLELTISK